RFSTDGRKWSRVDIPDFGPTSHLAGVVANGDRWFVAADFGDDLDSYELRVLTSADGQQWDSTGLTPPGPGVGLEIGSGRSGFVIGGAELEGQNYHPAVWTSPDGARWTAASMEAPGGSENSVVARVVSTARGLLLLGNPGGDTWIAGPDASVWTY